MHTRHLYVGLALAATALISLTLIFTPELGVGSEPLPSADEPVAEMTPRLSSVGPRALAGPSASTSADKPTTPKSANKPATPTSAKSRRAGGRGVVYLTFDDGPGPYTAAVLKILHDTGSTATFFELGDHAQEYPDLVRQVRAGGNAIGNHTYDHADLAKASSAHLAWELANGPRASCVRPPYGATNAAVRTAIHHSGARELLWTVDTRDWTRPGAATIITRASGPAVHDGSIVLMHDGGGDRSQTVAALPTIIQTLHDRGYVVRKLPGC